MLYISTYLYSSSIKMLKEPSKLNRWSIHTWILDKYLVGVYLRRMILQIHLFYQLRDPMCWR